ncbi:four helix bundle protein [Rhodonellum sp.]|uniref:four helix bundle protein n=1 Tax=Rhodonellum sp. TaxID=2231180 RepID=UPI002728286F|nr:four helix bundle protein [Rhodonellum sp.]MDO9553702.1 four helix bundle protein [Rhodonellum sp.]
MGRHRYEELGVWKKAVDLAVDLSIRTRKYPNVEKFSLVTQTNRAVYSISNNIAEGAGRGTNPDFRNFLYYSLGSLNETENVLLLALRLNYLEEEEYEIFKSNTEVIKKMLINLIKSLS